MEERVEETVWETVAGAGERRKDLGLDWWEPASELRAIAESAEEEWKGWVCRETDLVVE